MLLKFNWIFFLYYNPQTPIGLAINKWGVDRATNLLGPTLLPPNGIPSAAENNQPSLPNDIPPDADGEGTEEVGSPYKKARVD